MCPQNPPGITPQTIKKSISDILTSVYEADYFTVPTVMEQGKEYIPSAQLPKLIAKMEKEMKAAAKNMEFERAAEIRDRIKKLKEMDLVVGGA